jgi:hypothetical protein
VSEQQRAHELLVPVDTRGQDTSNDGAATTYPVPRIVLVVPLVVLGAFPLILLRFGTAPIADPDTLWHVAAGRELWSTWQFAGPDHLARFTQLPFVYHQWLPEILMAGANAVAGLPGVAWLFSAMLLGFVVALYLLCRGEGGILAAMLATITGWIGAGGSLSPRPQVFGFILLAVSLGAWLRTERDGRIRWWLILLTWLWACVHGTWLYAVGLAALFGLGMALDRRAGRRFVLRVAGLATALVAVAMLTPVGPQLVAAPLAVSRVSGFILEWKPTSITDPHAAATLLMGLVVMVAWVRGGSRVSWSRILLWGAGVGSALLYARTIAIGAILLAPLFAEVLQRWLPERAVPRRWELRTLGAATVASLVLAAVLVPATARSPGDCAVLVRREARGPAAGDRDLERRRARRMVVVCASQHHPDDGHARGGLRTRLRAGLRQGHQRFPRMAGDSRRDRCTLRSRLRGRPSAGGITARARLDHGGKRGALRPAEGTVIVALAAA